MTTTPSSKKTTPTPNAESTKVKRLEAENADLQQQIVNKNLEVRKIKAEAEQAAEDAAKALKKAKSDAEEAEEAAAKTLRKARTDATDELETEQRKSRRLEQELADANTRAKQAQDEAASLRRELILIKGEIPVKDAEITRLKGELASKKTIKFGW